MKLIIGLGNPGKEYVDTRHNTGYMVVDQLQKNKSKNFTDFLIKKSDMFMNDSGSFVKDLTNRYSLSTNDLYIVYDDLDLKLGEYKIQLGHSPKDHNGIKSVDVELGTDQYWHVKVGIDNRPLDNRPMGAEFVLQNFTEEERLILDRVIKEVASKLDNI